MTAATCSFRWSPPRSSSSNRTRPPRSRSRSMTPTTPRHRPRHPGRPAGHADPHRGLAADQQQLLRRDSGGAERDVPYPDAHHPGGRLQRHQFAYHDGEGQDAGHRRATDHRRRAGGGAADIPDGPAPPSASPARCWERCWAWYSASTSSASRAWWRRSPGAPCSTPRCTTSPTCRPGWTGTRSSRIIAMALVLSLLATLYPSWRAARTDPVEALRNV